MANILLGVSGGIAAYKACEVLRLLQQAGHQVTVTMTRSATELVGPATFRALSGRPVYHDMWSSEGNGDIAHIDIARSHDLFVLAPATANTLARLAHGLADNFLSTLALAYDGSLLLAPAMNPTMFEKEAVQENLAVLKKRGAMVVGPDTGYMACKEEGLGRMSEPKAIVAAARSLLERPGSPMKGKRVVVTAGATREMIDPVRFISNRSSGRMGVAMAFEASMRGADVVLIHGHIEVRMPPGLTAIQAMSAESMSTAVLEEIENADILIMSAAVADYRPKSTYPEKRKKSKADLQLDLEPAPDILLQVADAKRKQLKVVGFAAETEDVVRQGRAKLRKKDLDALFANDVSGSKAGMESPNNGGTLIFSNGEQVDFPVQQKQSLARGMWNALEEKL